ncbi:MAG TPA: protein kinase [Ktedonobacteraceae bacterium]
MQRHIKQGQICAVYQGIDQVLQRIVTVKITSASFTPAYRLAIKATAAFSHPDIVGLYDIVAEQETLYIVQEYIEGDDFSTLLQTQLSPYEVADLGRQICQALIYAGGPSRQVCHGDLVPTAIMRDRSGLVRVNNFALPSDLYYFENWCPLGGNGISVSDRDLPWGQQTEGRRDDDTRAVGLLLYQLLTPHPAGATEVAPPADGRLRFMRGVPPELCEVVARAIVRQHPQHISTPEAFYENLQILADLFEPPLPVSVSTDSIYAHEEPMIIGQHSPASSALAPALPARETANPRQSLPGYRPEQQSLKLPVADGTLASPTIADVSRKLEAARLAAHPELVKNPELVIQKKGLSPALIILLLGLVAFALFFIVGYFAGQVFFH